MAIDSYEVLEDMERAWRFRQAWDGYYGRFPKALKVRPGQPDDNIVANYLRPIVDKGVSFLFGRDVRFEVSETEHLSSEIWLDECWRANRKMTLLHKLALNGAICGHTFIKIVPRQPYPRLVVLDPATVTVRWQPDDIDTVEAYIIQYPAIEPKSGGQIAVRQVVERDGARWLVLDQQASGGVDRWTTVEESVWPWPWPPIADCQNLPAPNEYWGISDLESDIVQLNIAINFVLSNIARIIRYHAHPKTWGKGFTAGMLNIAVDETIVLPSPDAELHNLEMTSDLASSIALFERLERSLYEVTRVPEVSMGKLDRAGALSGVALEILYQPLLEKTETKRRLYGDLLIEVNRRLLALGGFGDGLYTVLHWPYLLPRDARSEAETAILYQQVGISRDTVLRELGFDPDLERVKREEERADIVERSLMAEARE